MADGDKSNSRDKFVKFFGEFQFGLSCVGQFKATKKVVVLRLQLLCLQTLLAGHQCKHHVLEVLLVHGRNGKQRVVAFDLVL